MIHLRKVAVLFAPLVDDIRIGAVTTHSKAKPTGDDLIIKFGAGDIE